MATKSRRQQRLTSATTGAPLAAATLAANSTNKANTVAVPLSKLGDAVSVTLLTPIDGVVADGYVSSPGTVTVRLLNTSGATISNFAATATVHCTRLG